MALDMAFCSSLYTQDASWNQTGPDLAEFDLAVLSDPCVTQSGTVGSCPTEPANCAPSTKPLSALVVIPARMGSARLPQKPLSLIDGVPMIVRVWRKAMESGMDQVVVACDHTEIADLVTQAGGTAVLTGPHHATGSDRVWEAVQKIDPQGTYDIILNLQGDVPIFPSTTLALLLPPFTSSQVDMATFIQSIAHGRPQSVKVRTQEAGPGGWVRCLDFSRKAQQASYIHQGVYAFRRQALKRFAELAQTEHELSESLEQLRALDHGFVIAGVDVGDSLFASVNTPQDLERVCQVLRQQKEMVSIREDR